MIENGKQYLITTNEWFYGPDGQAYRAAWGTVHIAKTEDTLGFTPARPSTNWFAKVGPEDNHVIIAGCQINYAVHCKERPTKIEGAKKPDKDGDVFQHNKIFFTE